MKQSALGFIRNVIAVVVCVSAMSLRADDVVYDATYYVNVETGLDTNDGSQAAPFQTLSKAWGKSAADSSVRVVLAKGTYPVDGTLAMDHSGVFHVEGETRNPKDANPFRFKRRQFHLKKNLNHKQRRNKL